ncbi:type 4a pilus biogenesis protein PilO [Caballeronia sp. LZ062]|uniref:type 4a pilus biogenesis protein PilO n=1 Tax=unclassified Caballeronia TaxID=2646786 RepID=UPI00285FCF1E|nr:MULTISPECIES: type 4a pilus biogenesis protein PilO [unclassified Caballeronia]MDR5855600.1 type 4a pilus biogenesis protein PilO [Caballeronia sp. LZ050]MDR5872612.1 type 4a pilus biogenesis protein PilO [Caballeronia sp. LZ062]
MSVITLHSLARQRPLILQPLDQWSKRRTAITALVFAFVVSALGVQGWRTSGVIQLDASRAALVATQRKLDDVGRVVAELPDLQRRVAASAMKPESWTAADALHAVAALATQNGLRVAEIDPQPTKNGMSRSTPTPSERALTFRAEGAFPEIRRFLEALAGLPRLVVPEAVQIRRQAGALTIDATLRIYDSLPAVPLAEPPRMDAFIVDPFGKGGADGLSRGAGMLLVGTLVGRHRAMALVQGAKSVEHVEPGQTIGDERLQRVQPRAIQLASGQGAIRTLTFAEDGK